MAKLAPSTALIGYPYLKVIFLGFWMLIGFLLSKCSLSLPMVFARGVRAGSRLTAEPEMEASIALLCAISLCR